MYHKTNKQTAATTLALTTNRTWTQSQPFEFHIGTSGWSLIIWDIQEVMLATGADSFLIWNTLKYIKLEVVEQKSTLYISQDWALSYFCVWKADSCHLVSAQIWEYLLEKCAHLQLSEKYQPEHCHRKWNVSVSVGMEEIQEPRGFRKSWYSRSSSLFCILSPASITFCFDSCQKLNERYLGKEGLSLQENCYLQHLPRVELFFW